MGAVYDLCIKKGTIVNADRKVKANVYIKNGRIDAITAEDDIPAARVINAEGRLVLPGFVDPHTHLNDPPGGDVSETFLTGTRSAAAGGVTTCIEMPLTTPVVSTAKAFIDKRAICGPKAVVDFAMFGACVPGNQDEIQKMLAHGAVAFKAFTPFSIEIPRLDDASMLKAMESLGREQVTLSIHCENADMITSLTEELQAQGRVKPGDYQDAHPLISELEAVQRVALMAYKTGARVHVVHCSCPEAVDVVSYYRSLGADLTVETCPHYLTLNEKDVERWGVYCICNPPIRDQSVQDELWKRVLEGKLDCIGTDHSAYLHTEKAEGKDNIFKTPAGITAMQLCYPLFFDEAVNKRGMSVEQFVSMSSTAAAKRYDIYPKKGLIDVGADADVVIFDPKAQWVVENKKLFYLEKWTPHVGRTVTGRVDETIVRGKSVYRDGEILAEGGYGCFVPALR